jgi:hypothetical protein
MLPWLRQQVAFVIRQRGDRHVRLADGSEVLMMGWALRLDAVRLQAGQGRQ